MKEIKPEGKIPQLKKGNNEIQFSGNDTDSLNPRLQVTVISEGLPLDI